ncbi:PREDICTED: cell division cycle 7-related protein kinase-like [Branchiostoma belcheri]|uniref:non-specific serine/threonine protein kinase n=1 Tax=Branchiostoma belcheri TaxID=7741 RepID=A0A6P4YSZ3_BRABE|nr:PREDICTED: cell division cycle 7-related protein kinase-like [Branchiostoma belcheri]
MSTTPEVKLPVVDIKDEETEERKKMKKQVKLSLAEETRSWALNQEVSRLLEQIPQINDSFSIVRKIGEGTFSSVYLATLKQMPRLKRHFALKHIIPTSHPDRMETELHCLQEIGGKDNVMGMLFAVRGEDSFVVGMPYFPHESFHEYLPKMSLNEVRHYMENLLIALRQVHQFGIIHRDVKPSNFLYSRMEKKYSLVDFGLAQPEQKTSDKHPAPVKRSRPESAVSSSPAKKKARTSGSKRENAAQLAPLPNSSVLAPKQRDINVLHEKQTARANLPNAKLKASALLKKAALKQCQNSSLMALTAKTAGQQQKMRITVKDRTRQKASQPACSCSGTPDICRLCTSRHHQVAPRAGTPGFRAPEVLLKCPKQTTSVDIWSAGVIFLSLLSGRYPFFRAKDDMQALAQIIALMGSREVASAAKAYHKDLYVTPTIPPMDLKDTCLRLRLGSRMYQDSKGSPSQSLTGGRRSSPNQNRHKSSPAPTKQAEGLARGKKNKGWDNVPDSAFDLLEKLLDLNPDTRITAEAALSHGFFSNSS